MLTKTIYLSRGELDWTAEMYPESALWGFNCKEYLDAKALAYELNDQTGAESNDYEDNLYTDISTAYDEGFDIVKFEWDGGDFE